MIQQQIEEAGWSVLYLRNKVAIEHSLHGEYTVCNKYVGGWGYEEELELALTWINERGYEETESYQKREDVASDDVKAYIDSLSDEEIEEIMGVNKIYKSISTD